MKRNSFIRRNKKALAGAGAFGAGAATGAGLIRYGLRKAAETNRRIKQGLQDNDGIIARKARDMFESALAAGYSAKRYLDN